MPLIRMYQNSNNLGLSHLPLWALNKPIIFYSMLLVVNLGGTIAIIVAFYNFGFMWGVISIFEMVLGGLISRLFANGIVGALSVVVSPLVTIYILGLLLGFWYL